LTGDEVAPIPNGTYSSYIAYGDQGHYDIKPVGNWGYLKGWADVVIRQKDWICEQVHLHNNVMKMIDDLHLMAYRQIWDQVLPETFARNFGFCTFFLLVCTGTPAVLDQMIVQVFGSLFREHYVDEDWVVTTGETEIAKILKPLGRKNDSARCIVQCALMIKEQGGLPRDYREMLSFPGVGAKIGLLTVHTVFQLVQGVPCDVYLCRVFSVLGWAPHLTGFIPETARTALKSNEPNYDYEFCRGAIERWFPRELWGSLNVTWAGLGQLMADEGTQSRIAEYIDDEVADWKSSWRTGDREQMIKGLKVYERKGR
jgi:endonuclease III